MDESFDFYIMGEDVYYIVNVMRMSVGGWIICCLKDGYEVLCLFKEVFKDYILCSVVEWMGENCELLLKIRIVSGFLKGDKFEWII